MEILAYVIGIGAVASALVGLGGYLHYRYGSKVKNAAMSAWSGLSE